MTHGKSVVVPVDDWRHVIGALKNAKARLPMGAAIGNVSDALSKVEHLQAAPAPSSLAGGDATWVALDENGSAELRVNGKRITTFPSYGGAEEAANRINAALSPEAPAREGVQWGWRVRAKPNKFTHDRPWHWQFDEPTGITAENCEYEPVYTSALTPRHEAPADDGPVFHMNLLSHEDNEAWLESTRRVAAKHEAPAEGAGEDVNWKAEYEAVCEARIADRQKSQEIINERDKWIVELIRESDHLRARSSAPEAREGEAVGYANAEFMRRLKNWRDGVPNSLRADETFLKAVSSESYPVALYTHPAAPSADKLRTAVEALEKVAFGDGGIGTHRAITQKALAALKAGA